MIEYRILVPCTTSSPLACGGSPSDVSDVDVRRDGGLTPVIPGTSLAGVLRDAFERRAADRDNCARNRSPRRHAKTSDVEKRSNEPDDTDQPCECSTCRLFGNRNPVDFESDSNSKHFQLASRVSICDVALQGAVTRVVDGVGINRELRTASDAKRFDHAEILPGARALIEIRVTDPSNEEISGLISVVRKVGDGRLQVGKGASKGLGQLKADYQQASLTYRDLNRERDLIAAIVEPTDPADVEASQAWGQPPKKGKNKSQYHKFKGLEEQLCQPSPTFDGIAIKIRTSDDSPFLISDPAASALSGFDHAPRGESPSQAELPGSSLRGCVRSNAERILRTIACCHLPTQSDSDTDKVLQTSVACHITSKSKCGVPSDSENTCCLACRMFGNTQWASCIRIHVEPVTSNNVIPFDHVSIDRFTGGARDKRKFNALAAQDAEFGIRFSFRECDVERDWMVGLLSLVLGDLHDGFTRVGAASSRGLGRFEIIETDWSEFDDKLDECVNKVHGIVKNTLASFSHG